MISLNFCKNILDTSIMAYRLQGICRTSVTAAKAGLASIAVKDMFMILQEMMLGTYLQTTAASDTAGGIKCNLLITADRFRIMAPETGHRASLEIYNCAHSGTIMEGCAGNICHSARHDPFSLHAGMLGSLDDMILHFFIQQIKLLTESGYAYRQISILIGMVFRCN